jgi:hypothetical protein
VKERNVVVLRKKRKRRRERLAWQSVKRGGWSVRKLQSEKLKSGNVSELPVVLPEAPKYKEATANQTANQTNNNQHILLRYCTVLYYI